MLKVAVVIYATDTSSMQMCGRGVERRVSRVAARRNQPHECRRTKVQLSGYYCGRTAGRGRIIQFFWSVNLISISAVL